MAEAPGLRRRAVLVAALLGILVSWSPLAAPPVLADGPLEIRAETRYTLDPPDGSVHVAIDFRLTNNKPNTPTVIYFYRELTFGIQPDARQVRASDAQGSLGVSTRDRDGYTSVVVRLRANLYYRRTTTFTVRYDLVGAPPRSSSPIRVGEAFSTFGVWAYGDPGQGTVEVRVPAGFVTTIVGDELEQSGGAGTGTVLRAEPARPDEFFAIVSAESRGAYEAERLQLPGGIVVNVLSWPEDDAWAETVSETLRDGLPILHEKVGLDWPVAHDLDVRERYTPALEGYAGVFFLEDQRIDVSEDLDPITILHEAGHAWFNDALFSERWIYEGLAEEYASRVHADIADVERATPEAPDPADAGFVALNTWRFPVIVREETDEVELYGYDASWWLMWLITDAAGEDGMRAAFANADLNRTAYPGAGAPEVVGRADDWRRFLDLTQPIEAVDPDAVLDAVETFVLAPGSGGILDRRAGAREAYRDLIEAGDGWLPPWYVRRSMGEWRFDDAQDRIEEAHEALALADQVAAAATAEGLALDDALETAYEGARDGLDGVRDLAGQQLAAIAALSAARAKVDAEPDLVSRVGLLDALPREPYEAARAAFEAGDLGAAVERATAAAAIIDRAPAIGQERLLLAGGGVAALLLVLLLAVILLRWRGHRRGVAAAATALDDRFVPSGAAEPAATLGAVPDVPAAAVAEVPPDAEGGRAAPQ